MQNFYFNIDVLGMGTCNLKCPSCPVGNWQDMPNPKGHMSPELLDRILAKATTECVVDGVGLFNWTEPFLHPKLPELVRVVHAHGLQVSLSSNLNHMRNIEEVLAENPHSLRISASGFSQETYGVTHRGGDIDEVKRNMIRLAEAKAKTGATTDLHVLYHRYLGNLDDEMLMKGFAERLGIRFIPAWAFFMPLEKILAYINDDPSIAEVTEEDYQVIDILALPLDQALAAAQRYKERPCVLQNAQVTLDYKGDVQLCCATYDSKKYTLGNYLTMPLADIQAAKYANDTCTACMDKGVHIYNVYGAPEFHDIALNHISGHYSRHLTTSPAV